MAKKVIDSEEYYIEPDGYFPEDIREEIFGIKSKQKEKAAKKPDKKTTKK